MDIIIHSLVISLWCLGFRTITDEGQILYFIRKPFEEVEGWKYYILKPIILCVTCTASFHGIIICCLFEWFEWYNIISIVGASFINSLGWLKLQRLF